MGTTTKTKSWREVVKVHPAAEVFPTLGEAELAELADDIKTNALQNPVALWEQLTPEGPVIYLLDGRNRLDAMEKVGIAVLNPEGTALQDHLVGKHTLSMSDVTAGAVVVGLNVHRRHLTPKQRATLTAKALLVDQEFLASQAPVDKPVDKPVEPVAGNNLPPTGQKGFAKGKPAPNKSIVADVAKAAGVSRPTARKAVADAKAEANGQAPAKKPAAKKARANTSKQSAVTTAAVYIADLGKEVGAIARRKDLTENEQKALPRMILDLRAVALELQKIIDVHSKPDIPAKV